jgi:acyl-CoA thioesterase
MADGDLEHALELRHVAEHLWATRADPNYAAPNGMYGGWTAAVVLGAASEDAGDKAKPSTLTIDFIKMIDPGDDLLIHTRRVGGGRSVSFWQVEMVSEASQESLLVASVVLAERRESVGHVDVKMPESPDPATIEVVRAAPGPMGERTTLRPIIGWPPNRQPGGDTYSTTWVRETSGRSVDHQQLAYLSDCRAPRSFYWPDVPRSSATVTLSVYFHATDVELAAVGGDEILSEAFGVRGAQMTSEEHVRLWSRHGDLLATSMQMVWYR